MKLQTEEMQTRCDYKKRKLHKRKSKAARYLLDTDSGIGQQTNQ